jgi:hypothetical protein
MKLLNKLFGRNKNKMINILIIVGVIVVAGLLLKYNSDKGLVSDGMSNNPFANVSEVNSVMSGASSGANGVQQNMQNQSVSEGPALGAKPLATTDGDQFLTVNGLSSGKKPGNTCNDQPMMDPKELLPTDKNNEWSNIMPNHDLKNIHMINAGHHVGINTVGSSLRNANLQVRSEPVIPQTNIGPWNNTTIEPDNMRRGFEIGASE